jgi:hypothetical protein
MSLLSLKFWRGCLVFAATVIGLSLWIPWYWPTISVKASSGTVDPLAGMPLSFSIENEGVLKAHQARYRCYFGHAQSVAPEITMNDSETAESSVTDVLLPHDPIDVSCPGLVSASANSTRVVEADVAILVSFRPSFDWRRSSACGRYALRKNAASQLAWFRKSSEPCKELTECLDRRTAESLKYRDTMRQFKGGEPWPEAPKYLSCLPRE